MLIQSGRSLREFTPGAGPDDRLIVASNRGPIEHFFDQSGRMIRRPAGGGLASALGGVTGTTRMTWLASPGSDADRVLAVAGQEIALTPSASLRFVELPEDAYRLHYEVFSNPVLWFVQHGIASRLDACRDACAVREAWERGYQTVNEAFAGAIVEQMRRGHGERAMIHDYHLYLVPAMVRRRRPQATLQHFVHVPWPSAEAWSALPRDTLAAICRGLLGNDSIVFQTDESASHFLETCARYLGDKATVSATAGEVRHDGRLVRVWSNPISVDVRALQDEVAGPKAHAHRRTLNAQLGEKTIVRVDRLDPSKNIEAGFDAFAKLLEDHPEWQGRVRMLAFLVPSRSSIAEYRRCQAEVFRRVEAINARYGQGAWKPVSVSFEHNRLQALVALSMYDVLLVNSIADGMNLVSKEGPVVNARDGVLVLSDAVGSFGELGPHALGVASGDVAATAEALDRALRMAPSERRERAAGLRETISRHQIGDWLRLQVRDLTITEYIKALA